MSGLEFVTGSLLLVAGAVLVAGTVVYFRISRMDSGEKRDFFKQTLKSVFFWLEDKGMIRRYPAFLTDYDEDFPKLRLLEKNYSVVREECLKLLEMKDQLTDISALGGDYTTGGIHAIQWKSFMFKSGEFIEDNCRLCPKTTEILRQIPGVYTAFFSILDPKQYVTPHFGYYRGFVRYHLGVIVPNNNEDHSCWLRVNADPSDNRLDDKDLVERGEKYYWRNGQGVVFDDTNLHDAKNDSDEVRVVLWLDVRKKFPFYLDWLNQLVLEIAHRDQSVKNIRRNSLIRP